MNAIARFRLASRGAIPLVALSLVACTETIREVPVNQTSGSTATGDNTTRFATLDDDSTILATGIEGRAGAVVDCEGLLPCRWLSGDGGLMVTATRVENSGATGGLEVDYRVEATRSASVSLGGSSSATDIGGAVLIPISRELDDTRGETPIDIAVSRGINGSVGYDEAAALSLSRWSVSLMDSGFARNAVFLDLPVGRADSAPGECEFILPCTWTSADGLASVTLTVAGGIVAESRLSVGLEIETATNLILALDGTDAIGSDGTRFQSRSMTLGNDSHYQLVTGESIEGVSMGAHVDFLRVATQPQSLRQLTLDLYRDEPVPRWDIRFEDVPLRATID